MSSLHFIFNHPPEDKKRKIFFKNYSVALYIVFLPHMDGSLTLLGPTDGDKLKNNF